MRLTQGLILFLALGPAAAAGARPWVLIDPGHGGADAGVQAPGFKESDYSLDLARRLKAQLAARGVDAQLTRDNDQELSPASRTAMANDLEPIALISLHANAAFQSEAHGARLFVPAEGPVDEPAAPLWEQASRLKAPASKALASALARALGLGGPRPVQSLKLALFRGLAVPACMVETEFASNPEGLAILKDASKRDALAARLAEGTAAWMGGAHAR